MMEVVPTEQTLLGPDTFRILSIQNIEIVLIFKSSVYHEILGCILATYLLLCLDESVY